MNTHLAVAPKTRMIIPLMTVAGFLTGILHGQTVGSPETTNQDEVVLLDRFTVTQVNDEGYLSHNSLSGSRMAVNLMKVPQSIQIANQQLLQDLGSSDDMMPAIEAASAGIVRRSFNPGDDQFIWGFRVISTLKDGLPNLSNAVSAAYDVERVEIAKGPSAMIFGASSTLGGVINYVTKKPTKKPMYALKATVGTFNYHSLAADASGPINNRLRYRLNVGAVDSDYSDRRFAFYENRFIGGGIEYDLSDRSKLEMDFAYYTNNSLRPFTMMDPSNNGKVIDMPDNYGLNEAWAEHPTVQYRGSATLTTILGADFTSRTQISYAGRKNDWLRDQVNGPLNFATRTVRKISQDISIKDHSAMLVQDFVKELDTGPVHHTFNFGLDVSDSDGRTKQTNYTLTNTWNYLNPVYGTSHSTSAPVFGAPTNIETQNNVSAIYAMDQMSVLNDKVNVLVGARYNRSDGSSGAPAPSGGTRTVTKGNYTAPRYGVILRPWEFMAAYYNYAESFAFQTGLDYLNRPLAPSIGVNNEYGLKVIYGGEKWSVGATLAVFDLKLTNVRVLFVQGPNDPNPGTQGAKTDGEQTNSGYDLSLNFHRKFAQAEVDLIVNAYSGDVKNEFGRKPVYTVNNTYGLFGTFRFTEGPLSGLRFAGGLAYKGERIGPDLTNGQGATWFPENTVSRAMIGYSWKKFSLQLNVENLEDDKYIIGSETAMFVFTDPGRTLRFSAGYRF
jgi:iron complex outermembrane receptor protein